MVVSLEFNSESNIKYTVIAGMILFFFTSVVNVQLGHILAFLVAIVVLFIYSQYYNSEFSSENELLEHKMNNLIEGYTPDYLYLDTELILLFDSIKDDLGKNNSTNFYRIVTSTDDLLQLRKIAEIDSLCDTPTPPDILMDDLDFSVDTECKKRVKDLEQVYITAKKLVQKILNYQAGLVIGTAPSPITDSRFAEFQRRLGYLLKKNLNVIKTIYKSVDPKQKVTDRFAPYTAPSGPGILYPEWGE